MKKIVNVFLCVLLVVSSLSVSVFAAKKKPFYLVLGDSIAFGSGLMNPTESCYGRIVADTNGYDYANYAIPGHTTEEFLYVLTRDFVIDGIKKADIINISIGGNDYLSNDLFALLFDAIVKEEYSRFDRIAESFYDNLATIVSTINRYNEDAVILMQTLYNPQRDYLRDVYQQAVDRINAAIKRFAKNNPGEIVIVNVGSYLDGDMENFAADDIHPSAKGNEKIAVVVLKKLKSLGLGKKTVPVINTPGENIAASVVVSVVIDTLGETFNAVSKVLKTMEKLLSW